MRTGMRVLISTDVVSRGLDFAGVNLVISIGKTRGVLCYYYVMLLL